MQIPETERLLLREFIRGDIDALAAIISDPETMRFYPQLPDLSSGEVSAIAD